MAIGVLWLPGLKGVGLAVKQVFGSSRFEAKTFEQMREGGGPRTTLKRVIYAHW